MGIYNKPSIKGIRLSLLNQTTHFTHKSSITWFVGWNDLLMFIFEASSLARSRPAWFLSATD